jgi:hypothetical protein
MGRSRREGMIVEVNVKGYVRLNPTVLHRFESVIVQGDRY